MSNNSFVLLDFSTESKWNKNQKPTKRGEVLCKKKESTQRVAEPAKDNVSLSLIMIRKSFTYFDSSVSLQSLDKVRHCCENQLKCVDVVKATNDCKSNKRSTKIKIVDLPQAKESGKTIWEDCSSKPLTPVSAGSRRSYSEMKKSEEKKQSKPFAYSRASTRSTGTSYASSYVTAKDAKIRKGTASPNTVYVQLTPPIRRLTVPKPPETKRNVAKPAEPKRNVAKPLELKGNAAKPPEHKRNAAKPPEPKHNVAKAPDKTVKSVLTTWKSCKGKSPVVKVPEKVMVINKVVEKSATKPMCQKTVKEVIVKAKEMRPKIVMDGKGSKIPKISAKSKDPRKTKTTKKINLDLPCFRETELTEETESDITYILETEKTPEPEVPGLHEMNTTEEKQEETLRLFDWMFASPRPAIEDAKPPKHEMSGKASFASPRHKCKKLRFFGNSDKPETYPDVRLKRHYSDPYSHRGFISLTRDDLDDSITSVASSLRHLNNEDMEDFMLWEAVPPQMTSCWEISLYQIKRPWSVLSCAVFKKNRSLSRPGMILEKLRGERLETRSSQHEELMTTPRLQSFDVEPSITQKNIDVRNWLAALNFYGPTSTVSSVFAESDCLYKACKRTATDYEVTKRRGSPKKRPRSTEKEQDKWEISIPPGEAPALDPEKSDVIKSLLDMTDPVGEQTKCVYMFQIAQRARPQRGNDEEDRKDREERKRGSRGSSGVRSKRSGSVNSLNLEDGVRKATERKQSIDWLKEEGVVESSRSASSRLVPTFQIAVPSGGIVLKHECELKIPPAPFDVFKTKNPEEVRKAIVEYGKQIGGKSTEEDMRLRRTPLETAESAVVASEPSPDVPFGGFSYIKMSLFWKQIFICAILMLAFCALTVFFGFDPRDFASAFAPKPTKISRRWFQIR